jgi:putative ABC transport system permease protein
MRTIQFSWKTFRHYFTRNLLVALGVAVSSAVLIGGLIIGDSVRYSLEQTTYFRLGNITHVATVTDRYFRSELANELQEETGYPVAPALILEGIAVADGGQQRVNKVQVIGINGSFNEVAGLNTPIELTGNDIVISENLAERLGVQPGDAILVRVEKASLIPKNAPFVSDTETSVTLRANVKAIAGKEEMGYFNLKNSQSTPYNLYISMERLNRLMEFEGRANRLLFKSEEADVATLVDALNNRISPADGSLTIRDIELTSEIEISSERVFMENAVVNAYRNLPGAKMVLTYFVNALQADGNETPYSFVASITGTELSENEIIINQWTAEDLNVRPGDSIHMAYFEIGPLRQLEERTAGLVLKEIVPMEGKWADGDLMPHLPGLSDAGHCREWEAGVPIVLDKIRQKDEAYWEEYKGIPKAFISPALAQKLWANRFGNYTAIRIPASTFSEDDFKLLFNENIQASDIGFAIQAVRDDGLQAARGGVDFSQLFLGLSFFLLVAAIILTTLLFKLNLENRGKQIGTLLQLGFRKNQITRIILTEAIWIAFAGILMGLILAVAYTHVVFSFLNTLWWDIVRTNVLFIRIEISTLVIGSLVSLIVVMAAILLPVKRFLKQQVAELHRKDTTAPKPWLLKLKKAGAYGLPILALLLLLWQILDGGSQNPAIFFLAGGLLLPGLLLWVERWLGNREAQLTDEFSLKGLSSSNLSRNYGRSLTVIILFALGTFLVVSTGANRQDMFSGAGNKTSGAGGFHFFAETSVPVLFDLNDPARRLTEGLSDEFTAVQFHRVEGDDASCLNLNRISNPAILGVNPDQMTERFSFVTFTNDLDKENPWLSLENNLDGGVVPAIADQTVIQWGLGMKVGDTLMYQNETGDTLKLKLIGGLAPSIFQGYIIIANSHFLANYPTHSGSSVFLIESNLEEPEETGNELLMTLRDYGWEMTSAPKRLAEFYSVTNTYLSIFLALGALGLALGTIGLALVLARSVIERRRELAILQAVGFLKRTISIMLIQEYGRLLVAGVGIGFLAAIVATLPAFFSKHTDVSFITISLLVILILINGFIWIYGLAVFMVKPTQLVGALRDE